MKIIIEMRGFRGSASLKKFITGKVSKLGKLHQGIISTEVTLEHESKKSKEIITCTIILNIPGKDEYVKASSVIFEDAVLKAVENAERRLRIRKTQKIERRKTVVKEKGK